MVVAQRRARLVVGILAVLTGLSAVLAAFHQEKAAPAGAVSVTTMTRPAGFDPSSYLADCQQLVVDYQELEKLQQILRSPPRP
jgi:hypothetical protein